jgi:hypothetical protein
MLAQTALRFGALWTPPLSPPIVRPMRRLFGSIAIFAGTLTVYWFLGP